MPTNNSAAAATNTQSLTPDEVIQIVRDMASRAPVVEPAAVSAVGYRRKLQRVEQELVDVSLTAINATPEVQSALGRTDVDVRNEDAAASDWAVAIESGRQFFNSLDVANGYRRQRVGLTALQTYQICRTLAREPRHAKTLAPHVETMRRVIAKYRSKPRTPEQPAPQQIAA